MIQRLESDAIRDEKDNRPLLHQKRRHRLTERNLQKVQVAEEKVLLEKETEFRADVSSGESIRTRHVIFGTLQCVSITSLNQDAKMSKNADSDTLRLRRSPAKKSKKDVVKGSVASLEGVYTLGCVCQDSYPRKSILREPGRLGSKHAIKFFKGTWTWHHIKIRERKGPSSKVRTARAQSARSLFYFRKEHKTKPCNEKDAPAEQHGGPGYPKSLQFF